MCVELPHLNISEKNEIYRISVNRVNSVWKFPEIWGRFRGFSDTVTSGNSLFGLNVVQRIGTIQDNPKQQHIDFKSFKISILITPGNFC